MTYVVTNGPATGPNKYFGNPDGRDLNIGPVTAIAFGPEAKLLALGRADNEVHILDLKTKAEIAKLTGLQSAPLQLSFSGDGKTIAAVASDHTTICIWDLSRDNGMPRQINHDYGPVVAFALSPDGKLLATSAKDGKLVRLWSLDSVKKRR
jgi:WD40 repeat protein